MYTVTVSLKSVAVKPASLGRRLRLRRPGMPPSTALHSCRGTQAGSAGGRSCPESPDALGDDEAEMYYGESV